jgi:hypothetical protein
VKWLPSLKDRPLKLDDALFESGTPMESKKRIEAALPAAAKLQRYETHADFEKNALADGQLVVWLQQQVSHLPPRRSTEARETRAQVQDHH